MNKVLIVLKSSDNQIHKELAYCLEKSFKKIGWTTDIINMEPQIFLFTYFQSMQKYQPDFLVSLDMAGFEMLTEAEEASYNRIPCRMAHLILSGYDNYRNVLEHMINFSMYFYTNTKLMEQQLRKDFPHIEHVNYLEQLNCVYELLAQKKTQNQLELATDTMIGRLLNEAELTF